MTNYNIIFQKLVDNGYEFDSNRYMKEGFELFKKYAGGFIGFFAIVFTIFFSFTYFLGNYGSIFTNLLQPIVTAGVLLVANELFKGNTPDFSKFLDGFKFYLSLLLLSIVSGIIIVIGLLFLIVPGIYLGISYSFASLFVVFLGYDFWPAMELSRKIISVKWWEFFGFFVLLFLINLAGVLACGVGVLFTSPLTVCITYVAFEDIIGGAIRKYSDPNPADSQENNFTQHLPENE
ncbi:MAG TPA: hypothetical protein PLL66_03280 [Bacteroidales bacterium]|nr:hypothetical protein [Bacteroidales bacterium]